jgi:hypothetical protein
MAEEPQHLGAANVQPGVQRQGERELAAARRDDERANAGDFSCERARTANVGVVPLGAHVRRSTGIIRKPVSSTQIRWAPRRRSFFYPSPVLVDPLAHAAIVALLRARLWALRTEATGPKQSPDVIRMVTTWNSCRISSTTRRHVHKLVR